MKQNQINVDANRQDKEIFVESSYLKLFLRFLRYGFLAWGGPIAQLALIQKEMVYQEKIVSAGYFNRLIAMYQAFPGPETHEICVHLGTQAKGPLGGLLAGLGFMMPGFILMMIFSWWYVLYGITTLATSILLGIKPAVIAWIVKGGMQLGRSILLNYTLWTIAYIAFIFEIFHVNFIITFLSAGFFYIVSIQIHNKTLLKNTTLFVTSNKKTITAILLLGILFLVFSYYIFMHISKFTTSIKASAFSTFLLGLKCGSLSFGSVYTILSIIKSQAITKAQWLTQSQFIDGLALAGALPAPFIIVTTFIGYIAYGFWGGILITIGTFLIPFLIPMFSYSYLNHMATNSTMRTFLDGVTAGVAGLIAADLFDILKQILTGPLTIGIFIVSLAFLYTTKSTYAIIMIIVFGALLSILASIFCGTP